MSHVLVCSILTLGLFLGRTLSQQNIRICGASRGLMSICALGHDILKSSRWVTYEEAMSGRIKVLLLKVLATDGHVSEVT